MVGSGKDPGEGRVISNCLTLPPGDLKLHTSFFTLSRPSPAKRPLVRFLEPEAGRQLQQIDNSIGQTLFPQDDVQVA